tara:strand:+ start:1014 stop:1466 length:453 start_codon:yes stop_codon:yes gene_type:complete
LKTRKRNSLATRGILEEQKKQADEKMGTNKRKRKAVRSVEDTAAVPENEASTCPVCFEAFECPDGIEKLDNALACPNQHLICLSCVSKLMKYKDCGGRSCSRFGYTCPLCRTYTCLRKVHMVVLATRSWYKAMGLFDHDPEKLKEYMLDM